MLEVLKGSAALSESLVVRGGISRKIERLPPALNVLERELGRSGQWPVVKTNLLRGQRIFVEYADLLLRIKVAGE